MCSSLLSACMTCGPPDVQGAAIAAAVCGLQQAEASRTPASFGGGSQDSCLRFVICCSGYPSPVAEHKQLQESADAIQLPSLHIYGAKDEDRQVSFQESRALAEQFDIRQRYVVEHSSGHIIPSSKAVVSRIRCFLQKCLLSI